MRINTNMDRNPTDKCNGFIDSRGHLNGIWRAGSGIESVYGKRRSHTKQLHEQIYVFIICTIHYCDEKEVMRVEPSDKISLFVGFYFRYRRI